MSRVNPTYYDRKRYSLWSKNFKPVIITEPIGWRTDEKEYARNKDYHGVFAKFSNNLQFINDGADFIKLVKDFDGINAEIKLRLDERHPITDIWAKSYEGYLDLSTYSIQNKKVSIKFNSGGIESLLKARESEEVEIERLDTMDGVPVGELQTESFLFDGRRIFLKTLYKVSDINNNAHILFQTESGNAATLSVGFPLGQNEFSHEQAVSVIPNTIGELEQGDSGIMYFDQSDRTRNLYHDFDFDFIFDMTQEDIDHARAGVSITIYKDGSDYNFKERINLIEWIDKNELFAASGNSFNVSFQGFIEILEGESLSLELWTDFDLLNQGSAYIDLNCRDIVCNSAIIEEDSFFEPSNCKIVLAHELGERLVHLITGRENAFYSEALGRTELGYQSDGEAALTGFAHGFWIRGFDKFPQVDDNKYKMFSTSFKDYRESLSVLRNLGIGIEKKGYKKIVRFEKLEYFYDKNVTIRLPYQVKNLKRSVAKEYYYSSVEIGFSKGGDYEEAMGLDEFNAKSTFTTIINRLKKSFKKVCKYRADSYGAEFARRKPKSDFPTEDTRYDKDVFVFDLKRGFDSFSQRKWQDDFEQEPSGIFNPETATNLRFSPINLLLRHGWVIAAGLTKYLNDFIRYASSSANSNLKTKLNGGNEYAENGKIRNSNLDRPRYLPEWIEFEHQVDFFLMEMVEGTTTIQGKEIPNMNGLIEFINEDNELEHGYLFNLKPNGAGQWKILKANR
jgi:hypothetical protein